MGGRGRRWADGGDLHYDAILSFFRRGLPAAALARLGFLLQWGVASSRALALAALLTAPPAFAQEPAKPSEGPVRILKVKPLKVPWSATRSSWERTKDVATTHWRAIPFAQLAAGLLLFKTAASTPYDLIAAPFRDNKPSEVDFELQGRLVDGEGKPAANAKVLVRCTSPWEENTRGGEFNYYETERVGPVSTDAEGRLSVKAKGKTGLAPRFMVHLDLEEGPRGAASAGAYAVAVSSTGGVSVTPAAEGSWRLVPAAERPAEPASPKPAH